ncbi:MAG: hypothetical protein WCO99_00910 [Planctomycetota bacterium]
MIASWAGVRGWGGTRCESRTELWQTDGRGGGSAKLYGIDHAAAIVAAAGDLGG